MRLTINVSIKKQASAHMDEAISHQGFRKSRSSSIGDAPQSLSLRRIPNRIKKQGVNNGDKRQN